MCGRMPPADRRAQFAMGAHAADGDPDRGGCCCIIASDTGISAPPNPLSTPMIATRAVHPRRHARDCASVSAPPMSMTRSAPRPSVQSRDLALPVRSGPVVDEVVGAELCADLELGVRRRRQDHRCAPRPWPTGARTTTRRRCPGSRRRRRPDAALLQRAPRRHAGAGQWSPPGRRSGARARGPAPAAGNGRYCCSQPSQVSPGMLPLGSRRGPAVQPARVKRSDHPVADRRPSVTPAPTATTSPAPSDIGTRGQGPGSSPIRLTRSW